MSHSQSTNSPPLALIVDDDLSIRISMRAALSKVGFEVIEAENGKEALTIFRLKMPDIVLLDVVMPEMDGFETCAAIRKMPKGDYVQIIMVTGANDSESTERAFEVGANDFISKPLNWIMLGHRGKYMLRASRAFQELSRSKSRLTKTQEMAKLGNWEIDLVTNTFECSMEASRLFGHDNGHWPNSLKEFLTPVIASERDKVLQTIESALRFRKPFTINHRVVCPGGTQRHILNQGEILYNENGNPELMLGAIQDVSELHEAEQEIRRLAFYDGLTGLANRMLLMDRLNKEIAFAERKKQVFALLFLDLDQFKKVNDSYGHHIGDHLLKNIATTLKNSLRKSDTPAAMVDSTSDTMIARLGGDEFTILLSDIEKPENAAIVARRLLNEIPTTSSIEGHEIMMTTSIGIGIYPVDGRTSEDLLKNADYAMYQAKDRGRNNYQFYDESLNLAAKEQYSIERDIRLALERDEFVLYYQPQIDLSTGHVVGAEALIRWQHPHKGLLYPDSFIHIAEESGLIQGINSWVIQAACKQCSEWTHSGYEKIRVAINLSGYHFSEQDFIKVIKNNLQAEDLSPDNLEVEITENILMQGAEETVSILEEMRDLHLRISLDDFGTGYSSLSYLTSFPVDTIKIDRSFVMGCTTEEKNKIIIKAIIAMGHSLGLKIIAEGIETKEHLEVLKELGCNEGQGYYFMHPIAKDEFMDMLASNRCPGFPF